MKITKAQWESIGKQAGWLKKEAQNFMRPIEISTKLKIDPSTSEAYLIIPEFRKEIDLGHIDEIKNIAKDLKMRGHGFF